ncbi:MAG: carboxypeptidase-like regulatory domain-containing protein, partial [Myxococcota bacterium]
MLVTLLLLGCHPTPTPAKPVPTETETGDGLFAAGCPIAGESAARVLTEVDERPWGPDALAAPGDVLLLNERAAFVLQDPTAPRTYYHYGGLPIDAVAVDGCEQAGPEVLGEMGLIVGQLDLVDFETSTLHMVRGTSVEIVSDGRDGGPAIVDVHATDDRFWLVELTLMRRVFEDGGRKELGELYGLDLTLRYTLPPEDAALQLDVLLGGEPVADGFLVGGVLFPSDHTTQTTYASGDLSVGGIGLDVGVPFIQDASAEGSTALGMPGGTMALTTISGVTALLDVNHVGTPLSVGDTARFVLAVSGTDGATAAAALEPHLDDPVPGFEATWHDVAGVVRAPDGEPVTGAVVEVASPVDGGGWRDVTTFVTDAEGRFAGRALAVGGAWRLTATGEGRDDGAAVEIAPTDGGEVALDVGAVGSVTVAATDGAGAPLAVRVELERDDGATVSGYATPASSTPAVLVSVFSSRNAGIARTVPVITPKYSSTSVAIR